MDWQNPNRVIVNDDDNDDDCMVDISKYTRQLTMMSYVIPKCDKSSGQTSHNATT
jgi:hypothetical protein